MASKLTEERNSKLHVELGLPCLGHYHFCLGSDTSVSAQPTTTLSAAKSKGNLAFIYDALVNKRKKRILIYAAENDLLIGGYVKWSWCN